jgi:hypothetical protein
MDEQANAPARGNLSKVPYRLRNSPTKFRVNGVRAARERIKNNMEKIGISSKLTNSSAIENVMEEPQEVPPL